MGFDSDMIDLNMNEENDNNPSPIGEPALSPEDLPDWYDMENPLCNRGFDLGSFCVLNAEMLFTMVVSARHPVMMNPNLFVCHVG